MWSIEKAPPASRSRGAVLPSPKSITALGVSPETSVAVPLKVTRGGDPRNRWPMSRPGVGVFAPPPVAPDGGTLFPRERLALGQRRAMFGAMRFTPHLDPLFWLPLHVVLTQFSEAARFPIRTTPRVAEAEQRIPLTPFVGPLE